MKLPPLATEITRGPVTVQIYGRRSTKGWTVRRVSSAGTAHIGARDRKDKAIRLALDAGLDDPGTYHVKPSAH